MRHDIAAFALLAVIPLLVACNASQQSETAVAPAPSDVADDGAGDAARPEAPAQQAGLGHYTIADTTVAFVQATRLPDVDGKLRLLLTPEMLSPAEQAVVRAESWPGMSLLSRTSARYGDRYPFVVIEVRTEGAPAAENVRHVYVMASGIAEANHIDNINRSVGDYGVERLQVDGDRISLRLSGREEINGEVRAWSFDLST